jgi:hypothetical protein
MDQFLAEFYGTGAPEPAAQEDELEKMAQLTLLSQEAKAEGFDLSQLSDEEIIKVAQELYGSAEGGTPAPEADLEKEAQAKFEEADFLGRVMAHSFNQELGEIEKQAGMLGRGYKATKGALGKAYEKTLGRVGAKAEELYGRKGLSQEAFNKEIAKVREAQPDLTAEQAFSRVADKFGRRSKAVGIGAQVGAGAAGAGAAGGLGYGGYKGVQASRGEKRSSDESAYEQLVAQRMYQHLDAAGYDADAFFGIGPEKTAADEFEAVLDQDALERLEQAGVPINWNR